MSELNVDPEAVATYAAAAAEVSGLLGTTASNTDTAAGADLSGLGLLGADFAQAWTGAAQSHADTVRTAAALIDAHATLISAFADRVQGIDAATAAAVARLTDQES
ncbi:hypothetical protein ACWDYH_32575 [Nocardia goodfellowii]|uniref:2-keto-3-deoxy-galactonokinase n=1 Tax=Nocardia goodfellowii TaxID=882446 RepID=A0ABS4QNR8_9NOCA|nr:hypothetical protein [Nocardia goodfellowii]MBP2193357.1 2-keto-3-deoxy-galactonokinase [Nocardia goodfellowii]